MRYVDFFNTIVAMHRTPPTKEQSQKDARLNWGGWDRLRKEMPSLRQFVLTGFPLVDEMVLAHSPVIHYTLPDMEAPRTFTEGLGYIELPPPAAFMENEYPRTLLHEMSHWAGNPHHGGNALRDDLLAILPAPTRDDLLTAMLGGMPTAVRVLEELTAEISAYTLAQSIAPSLGTETFASYVGDWLANAAESGYTDAQALFTVAAEQAYSRAAYLLHPLNLTPKES